MAKKRRRQLASHLRRRSQREDFDPDYSHVIKDLRRIGVLAGSFIAILVLLSFFLN